MKRHLRPVLLASGALTCLLSALSASQSSQLPPPALDEDFLQASQPVIALGQMLFFDKILSGNRNTSCATCHSPVVATGDGLSINIGTGGRGLSVLRDAGSLPLGPLEPLSRGSRNMQPLFNLGHADFDRMFWDGRLFADPSVPQGFQTPAGDELPIGFEHVIETVSIFAPTDLQEMTGQPGTNELATASVSAPFVGVWDGIVARLKGIPEYLDLFFAAYPDLGGNPDNIEIVHVGKAIGAFQAQAFRSDDSPFDRYLRGENEAMSESARDGMKLFYGEAGCASCHSGTFQTDLEFYAIAMPQIGPGFGGVGWMGLEDFGREGVTGDPLDRYRFRTPSLRNVELTGPWGHDGFFNSLELVVRHHLHPIESLYAADPSQIVLPSRPDLDAIDLQVFGNPEVTAAIARRNQLAPQFLGDAEIADILEFLRALTDPSAVDLRKTIPARVPSGLPLAEIRDPQE
jgi:cytochrome c peroxidase